VELALTVVPDTIAQPALPLRLVWMEITGRCQLECAHCYAASGPRGTHGTMATTDWFRVIRQAATLRVRDVQLIGGEPTLHPDLPVLVRHALDHGMAVEVYTNLARVTEQIWQVFEQPGVRLATSYYSSKPAEHEAVTGRRRSHDRTRANIAEAVARRIPIRVGMTKVHDGQDVEGAIDELQALGVEELSVDRLRQVGRGARHREPALDQLCGHCGRGNLAVSSNGLVWPCVFSRWLILGSVHRSSLASIVECLAARRIRALLARAFAGEGTAGCAPGDGSPCQNPLCDPHLRPRGGTS
jgi:MoaA/NifB/PqqE/SkfB family radical SAM enzyme